MTENTFLSRWSRLKSEKQSPVVEEPKPLADLQERIAALPSIESIVSGSDISVFMQTWVPSPLKNAVLRKIWSIDASLTEHLCQPLDYAYDYNNPVGVMGFGALPEGYNVLEEAEKLFKNLVLESKPQEIEMPLEEIPIAQTQDTSIPEQRSLEQQPTKKHGGALPA